MHRIGRIYRRKEVRLYMHIQLRSQSTTQLSITCVCLHKARGARRQACSQAAGKNKLSDMSGIILTDEQIAHFDDEGFLILRASEHGLIDTEVLKTWTNEVRNLPREHGKWMPYDEITESGERQLMRTENFVDYHSGFSSLLNGQPIKSILKQLTRDDMLLFKDKINYKLAGGNGFGAHLDAPAYDHIEEIEHTTANLAVDPATLENGCVEVVPKSHRMKVELAEGGRIDPAWEARQQWVPVELESGDLLIFGSHLAHRSKRNATSNPRASIYATYHNVSDGTDLKERYYKDRRENFPPDHERIPGKDYGAGVKRYAFAAPFTKIEEPSKVQVQHVA
ncbi:2-aminoethylphosphonate dioxygenase [Pseudocercospora fuligena]|uniref:2-aminoethylphosphonate dioxygenase n=1 Tax=Pseudocercospora fuligena TaxID=685502 RepID=A0A8H6RPZ1_9PEZI|nr:2-aminoethylphosphonate dioxygenase [Pseudocercospora fuligena]